MDDYSLDTLTESKNEWSARLVLTLTPLVISGFKSIYSEADKLCIENDEEDKVLMTFQNLISRIPKWSNQIVVDETVRIKEESRCEYIEELITCVHITHLKALTAIRVGQKQKRIEIDVPPLDKFIHTAYIHCARAIYKNVYLFDTNVAPLTFQKQNRELEMIVREGILESIRSSVPIDRILRAYLDKTEEEEHIYNEPAEPAEPAEPIAIEPIAIEPIEPIEPIATKPIEPIATEPMITNQIISADVSQTVPINSSVQFSNKVDEKFESGVETSGVIKSADDSVDGMSNGTSNGIIKIGSSVSDGIHLDIEDIDMRENDQYVSESPDQISLGDIEQLV